VTYKPFAVERFGGLNLMDDPREVGTSGAVDLLNVDLDKPGTVRTRDGFSTFTASAAAIRYDSLYPYFDAGTGARYLVAGSGTTVQALSSLAAIATSVSGKSASPHSFARVGSPTFTYVYCANGTDTVFAFNPSIPNFFVPAYAGTTPTGKYVAVQAKDNRLVSAAQSTNRSRVLFSDAGDPNTFGANNYVDLTPGDGEQITGMMAWRDFLFVFKSSRYFVFYGNSTDSAGNPVFNFRTVDTGVGLVSPRAVAATRDGVYFLSQRGVYRTNGGDPELVSGPIDRFFRGEGAPALFGGSVIDLTYSSTSAAMCAHRDRIYLAVPTATGAATNDRTLVYDPKAGWWSLWDLPAAAMVSWRSAAAEREELHFAYSGTGAGTTRDIGRVNYTATADAGTAITSRYRLGFTDVGVPEGEKTIREWILEGSGTLNFKTSFNDGSLGTAQSIALGTAPAIAQGRDRRAMRGRNFSVEMSATSGAWSVSRLVGNIRGQRGTGPKAT
jgi:hypothetical protein